MAKRKSKEWRRCLFCRKRFQIKMYPYKVFCSRRCTQRQRSKQRRMHIYGPAPFLSIKKLKIKSG